jgi:hypothetical protein
MRQVEPPFLCPSRFSYSPFAEGQVRLAAGRDEAGEPDAATRARLTSAPMTEFVEWRALARGGEGGKADMYQVEPPVLRLAAGKATRGASRQ